MNWATVTHQQVWLVWMGAAHFLLGPSAECKCEKIGRRGVLGPKPRNHIRLRAFKAVCRGPGVRNCPRGSGSPSSSALLHPTGRHLAACARPLLWSGGGKLGQVLKRGCKGHPVAS